ncbi:MAG: AtpZ/AtpI family protein [Dehalococcoidia bacterium]|nr:AtpZ/AtpI family protein [Dehalococcoidia bacterium]
MLYSPKSRGSSVKNSRVWQLLTLGWYVAACIVGGILAGIWLDQSFGTPPLFLLLGLALGLTMAFWGMLKMLKDLQKFG